MASSSIISTVCYPPNDQLYTVNLGQTQHSIKLVRPLDLGKCGPGDSDDLTQFQL